MKVILSLACLVLLSAAPAVADGNPDKHWDKQQEKLWKEQRKQEQEWLKAERKYEKELRKREEKLFKEQMKLERERARWSPWFDDRAPRFGDTWPGFRHHPDYSIPHMPAPAPYGYGPVPRW